MFQEVVFGEFNFYLDEKYSLGLSNRSLVPTNSRNNALERVAQNPIRFHEENGMMVPDG
jgi:hypothetical protein